MLHVYYLVQYPSYGKKKDLPPRVHVCVWQHWLVHKHAKTKLYIVGDRLKAFHQLVGKIRKISLEAWHRLGAIHQTVHIHWIIAWVSVLDSDSGRVSCRFILISSMPKPQPSSPVLSENFREISTLKWWKYYVKVWQECLRGKRDSVLWMVYCNMGGCMWQKFTAFNKKVFSIQDDPQI